ncbi:MAG: hypothetical protein HY078_14905 [Elusimicrobia bacterium]|nr:hypothetical protein [Elusimicrobiota bacterium]
MRGLRFAALGFALAAAAPAAAQELADVLGERDAFWLGAAPLPDEEDDDGLDQRGLLSLGLRGSFGREAQQRSVEWGPTLSLEIGSSEATARNRFKYELEYSYNDALTKLVEDEAAQTLRVRTHELRYAKVSLLRVAGFDVGKRFGMVPYLAGGVQYVDSRGDLGEEGRTVDFYWAPTMGAGLEMLISRRTTLALDYEQNFEGERRRISRFSFELKLRVFGEEDE